MTKLILGALVLICVIQACMSLSVECPNGCQADECCVSVATAILSKRLLDIPDLSKLTPFNTVLKSNMCRKIRRQGERCLVNNRSGEWCDCEAGANCVSNGKSGLDRFFGTCTKA